MSIFGSSAGSAIPNERMTQLNRYKTVNSARFFKTFPGCILWMKSERYLHQSKMACHGPAPAGWKVKTMQGGNGGDYVYQCMEAIISDCGINIRATLPYNPHQNSVAERLNHNLRDFVRSMVENNKIPKIFGWKPLLLQLAGTGSRIVDLHLEPCHMKNYLRRNCIGGTHVCSGAVSGTLQGV